MDELKPYTVEKHEGVGCPHCGADEMWDVVFHSGADDEIGLSTAYGDEDEAENVARDCNDAYAKGLTALKLAATEQATHAEAVLEERTRERDALALSQGRLLEALKNILSGISSCHYCGAELIPERGAAHCEDCPSGCEAHDAPDCVQLEELAEAARAAIAEATPEGETRQ